MKAGSVIRKVRRLLPHILSKRLPREILVVEVGPKTAQILNRRYRHKSRPANVLSFRYGTDYGEILICPAVIRREAKIEGNSYKYQMTWLMVHGMLHLAGLHHEKSKKLAKKAEKLEQRILGKTFVN